MIDNTQLNLTLASNSQARKDMLTAAGIAFTAQAADIDENIIKHKNVKLQISPAQTAQDLADAKALYIDKMVSKQNQTALTLGCDQICHIDGEILNKPATVENLYSQIKKLAGKTHILSNGLSLVQNGEVIFKHQEDVFMTMYELSDGQIEQYIAAAPHNVVEAAGGYHLESNGVQLFKQIEGSYFGVLGLSMLPLIGFLREFKANK